MAFDEDRDDAESGDDGSTGATASGSILPGHEAGDGQGGAPDQDGTRPRRKRTRRVLLVLVSLLVVLILVVVGFGIYLNNIVGSNVKHAQLLPPDDGIPRSALARDAQNILLIGSDSRTAQIGEGSRSDVIQLVHISDDRRSVQVIHFPRDLYVPIPGYGKNKINAAYSYGGAPLLVLTLQQLLEVHIDHVAQISFEGFKRLTDELGGVTINVAQATDEKGFGDFPKGEDKMNGTQALGFVRERHQLKLGDIDRGKRQQAWIKAMAVKTLRPSILLNPVRVVKLLKIVTSDLTVDQTMTTSYLRTLALQLRNVRAHNIVFRTAPYSGFARNDDGDIDVLDKVGMDKLGKALRLDEMSTLPGGTHHPG